MATRAPSAIKWLASSWARAIRGSKCSGIVGDLAHKRRGGYHISRQDQPSSNYSVAHNSADRRGNSSYASALDMNQNREQMIAVTKRVLAAAKARDPRLTRYVNAFNGTVDGKHAIRIELRGGHTRVTTATADHLWHTHLEIYREFANSKSAMRSILSVVTGVRKKDPVKKKVAAIVAGIGAVVGGVLLPGTSTTQPVHPATPATPPAVVITVPVRPMPAVKVKPAPLKKAPAAYKTGTAGVRVVQRRLGLRADGDLGPKTRAKISKFQKAHHLRADGLPGPKTWRVMFPK